MLTSPLYAGVVVTESREIAGRWSTPGRDLRWGKPDTTDDSVPQGELGGIEQIFSSPPSFWLVPVGSDTYRPLTVFKLCNHIF